jgi:hypothetical protein
MTSYDEGEICQTKGCNSYGFDSKQKIIKGKGDTSGFCVTPANTHMAS